jgi:hypothetical protein
MGDYNKYARLYARKKSVLFPLIEKYSGYSLKGKTHGQAIEVYLNLLKTNAAFCSEVDSLIPENNYNNLVLGAVVSGVLGMFTGTNQDAQFAATILEEQKAKNTQTYLIVGGITLVSLSLIGLGIYLAVKKKR